MDNTAVEVSSSFPQSSAINETPLQETLSEEGFIGPTKSVEKSVGVLTYQFEDRFFHFITDPTDSFSEVVDIAKSKPNSILIDRHFNAGGGYGYLTIPNPKARNFAMLLNDEYEKIYQDNGWHRSTYTMDTSKTSSFDLLSIAHRNDQAALIDEFGFKDDSRNGTAVIEWMKTAKGQHEIANACIRASLKSEFEHVVLSAGHWGPRGYSGASYDGWHETDYAFSVFTAMVNTIKTADGTDFTPEIEYTSNDNKIEAWEVEEPKEEKPTPSKTTTRRKS